MSEQAPTLTITMHDHQEQHYHPTNGWTWRTAPLARLVIWTAEGRIEIPAASIQRLVVEGATKKTPVADTEGDSISKSQFENWVSKGQGKIVPRHAAIYDKVENPEPCSVCKATWEECNKHIKEHFTACCGSCQYTATHNQFKHREQL